MRRPSPRARTVGAALVGLLGGFAVTSVGAVSAAAEEVVERPADGIFDVEGHGWGHGRGMSQWGAQGAASQGESAETIVSTYYPGTARTVLAAAPIRVLMQGDEGRDTVVFPADQLSVTDLSTGTSQLLPTGPTRWRAVVDADGLHVQGLAGSTWTEYALGGGTSHGGPIRFSSPGVVRLAYPNGSSRDYRGAVQAVRTGTTSLQSVVVLPLEDYLLGVVPRESSSSWKPAALQAQAVAARSYSANKRARVAGRGTYDICDTTQCQVFGGSRLYTASGAVAELEPASTTAAVRNTAGVVRTYNGAAIFSEFSSSNGGWSTKGDVPYLIAQRDDWDGALDNPVHEWDAALRATDLERRFPAVGTLQRIRITGRDGNGEWGGRVKAVVLEGVSSSGAPTSVSTTGAGVYNARTWPANSDGLRSTWFRFAPATTPASSPAREQDSRVSAASVAPVLVVPPGAATGRLTVSMVNTGSAAWPVTGLHLAFASPAGQADGLASGSTRPGAFVRNASRPGATTVEPRETADFAVALNAAQVPPGRYPRAYRVRIDDGPVFGETASWQVEVQAAKFTAAYAGLPTGAPGSGDAPSAVWADGRTVVVPRNGSSAVRITLRDSGNVSWPGGSTSPVQLGTSGPRNRTSTAAGRSWVSRTRGARLTATTRPGSSGVFDLVVNGNGRPVGVTPEAFEPLWAGRGWLTGAARTFNVVRYDPAVSRLAVRHSGPASSVSLTTGATTVLVVRLRNLGGAAWPVGTERLGTSGDKAYALATTAWASPSRPPALSSNAVRPGAAAVYPGEIGEWRIPVAARTAGTYDLVLQAVGATARYGPVLTTRVTVTGTASRSGADSDRALFKGSGLSVLAP